MKPICVLIVEDEALEAFLLSDCFRMEGYHVCQTATSGSQAVLFTRQEQPDIIVMDVGLAGSMSGIETACQIRTFSSTPILFLSGYLSNQMKTQIEQLTPAGYLSKPARFNEVLREVQQLLNPTASAG